ncbi:MOSC domain-containing protein [Zafaria sp. Z1313]|uniref:MOSC domain-containing protein n=1 Tax=unclassified Zafaria TaxID=2828765 RepID=UPI003D30305B
MEPLDSGRLVAVCRVHQLLPDRGSVGVTAIDKRPVEGPVKFGPLGLHADVQANRAHHGGPDQAVYAYSEEEAARWGEELGRGIEPGLFGENLRVSGMPVSDAVIGERWRIGTAELEVTMPRTPCATFARRLGEERWVVRFTERADTGCYLKVVRKGKAGAGDGIAVVHRPAHGVTVRSFFTGPSPEDAGRLLAGHEGGEWVLPEKILARSRHVLRAR